MLYRSLRKTIRESFRQVKYLPAIYLTFSNWFIFLLDHLRIRKKDDLYLLRNGMKIYVDRENDDGWSPGIVMDILIKKDYGLVPENITVVDIGANIGVFSLYASYNKNNMVYAYEPMTKNFALLRKNISENKLEGKIKTFRMAVAGDCSERKLYTSISMSHSITIPTGSYEKVQSIDLKGIFLENKLEKADIVKIDCEGGEYEIIYSADKDTIRKISTFVIEYHNLDNKDNNGEALIKYFRENLGYSVDNIKKLTDKLGLFRAQIRMEETTRLT